MDPIKLVFLGTGGGRFATITQKRRTGGIRIISKKNNIHIDPGPGALIYSLQAGLNPQKINAILVSHRHPDHYNDAEVLVEAMTKGMTKKRGIIAAPANILLGNDIKGPAISKYHQKMLKRAIPLKPGIEFEVENLKITSTKTKHSDSEAVGFRLEIPEFGEIGYSSDTEFFDDITAQYKGVELLILSVMRPAGNPWKGHMTPEDAVKFVSNIRPKMVITTHFGMKMIASGPIYETQFIEKKTGIPSIAAFDGMVLELNENKIGRINTKY